MFAVAALGRPALRDSRTECPTNCAITACHWHLLRAATGKRDVTLPEGKAWLDWWHLEQAALPGGTTVTVEADGAARTCRVVAPVFHDPAGERLRA